MLITVAFLLGSIPSPGSNSIGPFQVYGLAIGLGAALAVWLASKRWMAVGGGEDDMASIGMWAIPAGVIGARAYHVITDFQRFSDGPWYKVFFIWEGGLGIPGGMALGILVGLWAARQRGMQVKVALDAAVPGLPLAQAVGRLGNYFNQELYGRPTSLPWGLEIDAEHRYAIPSEWQSVDAYPTFHPTFLYELLWNLALTFVLLRVDARQVLPRGRLIAVYLLGYGIGRLWIETIKIDTVNKIFGLRINIWMAGALILAGLAMLFWPGGEPRLAEGESPYRDGHEPDTGPQDADVNSDDAADAAPQDDVSDKDGSDDASSVTADGPDS